MHILILWYNFKNLYIENKSMKKKSFKERVYNIVRRVPKGKVITYKRVAEKAGSPRAYRAVGSLMHRNPFSSVPCHRVVKSDGSVGGFSSGVRRKIMLLKKEGLRFRGKRILEFEKRKF
jgi:methylated-DNA-[protein]-cysteine S-methyltransferase